MITPLIFLLRSASLLRALSFVIWINSIRPQTQALLKKDGRHDLSGGGVRQASKHHGSVECCGGGKFKGFGAGKTAGGVQHLPFATGQTPYLFVSRFPLIRPALCIVGRS